MNAINPKIKIEDEGYCIIPDLYTAEEIQCMVNIIDGADISSETFRKSDNLFAIRQVLKEIPALYDVVLNSKIKELVKGVFGENYFIVKSIYFDKPGGSNWFVAWHQDLTISVREKNETEGFGPWTVKHNQYAVQPPLAVLQNIYTIRIHLDDTDKDNGALKVIPNSHSKGIYRVETMQNALKEAAFCAVPSGGIMIMKPLIMHSSSRTINENRRRVIHIEFSNELLPGALLWSEKQYI